MLLIKKILKEWKLVSLEQLPQVVLEIRNILCIPSVILLEGEVGAGKTTLVKNFAQDGVLQSPSYSIFLETPSILHADFYRITNPEEILYLEIPEYIKGKKFLFIEWGKKFYQYLKREIPTHLQFYLIEIVGNGQENQRDIFLYQC